MQATCGTMCQPERLPFLDLLRLIAAQVIVWHHLAFYGPLSDIANEVLEGPINGLYGYGGMAVQIFLVTGGFLCAQSLLRVREWTLKSTGRQLAHRYWRLAWPYFFAVGLAILANSVAAEWMDHEAIAAFPTWDQLVAHTFFLQAILGYEQLSAGIWYLGIDFQLFALCTLVTAASHWFLQLSGLANRISPLRCTQGALALLAATAMYYWNRTPELDVWAIYYLGSYFLGMAVAWWLAGCLPNGALVAAFALAGGALAIDWRTRLAIALTTAIVLAAVGTRKVPRSLESDRNTGRFAAWAPMSAARLTYSLFLVHFPVCLVLNAVLSPSVEDQPWLAFGGMVVAYVASMFAAIAFYHLIEAGDWWHRVSFGSADDRRVESTVRAVQ